MLPWFLRDSNRLTAERDAIESLAQSSGWLVGHGWRIDSDGFGLDAVIRAHEHDYELRLTFPALYPFAPSTLRPLNVGTRLTSHQYGGAGGPLCLEWGPDNWTEAVMGAQMLESAYRLLETENPLGRAPHEPPATATSRHSLTVGQQLRTAPSRWYYSKGLEDFLSGQVAPTAGSLKFSLRNFDKTWICLIHEATTLSGEVWSDSQIPLSIPGAKSNSWSDGVWIKTTASLSPGVPNTLDELRQNVDSLSAAFLATDGSSPIRAVQEDVFGALVTDASDATHFFVVVADRTLLASAEVRSPLEADANPRTQSALNLSEKSIGIVGLGSAGSKIAVTLARMGVRKFFLVDHDVLLPENLARHALNWESLLLHKVDGVAAELALIDTSVLVETSRQHLTGQESTAAVSGALDRLARCDVIVDATANPTAFNLLSAISSVANRALVWLEVFAGGVGGFVARSRPGSDVLPQSMRLGYLQYCSDNPPPAWMAAARNYGSEDAPPGVVEASDADVSVIAHHAAQLVADCCQPPEVSAYPESMYLVGLKRAWVFTAPFHTVPLRMPAGEASPDDSLARELSRENVDFLTDLLRRRSE